MMPMKLIRCCKDCPDRHLACHDTCERYRQEHREYQAEKEAYCKGKNMGYEYDDFRAEQIRKAQKHRRKK